MVSTSVTPCISNPRICPAW